jgi:hypothetical protein
LSESKIEADERYEAPGKASKPNREQSQPYASEVDDYANDATVSPAPSPKVKVDQGNRGDRKS